MTREDASFFADWLPATLPAAIVVSAIVIAYGFGPNCAPTRGQLLSADQPAPMQPEARTSTEAPPTAHTSTPACKQWAHTRLEDCKAQKGEFIRCLWWVFGGDHPDDYDLEPHRWDGPGGYGTHQSSDTTSTE